MQIFEKIYSNHKIFVLIIIFTLSIIAYGVLGYAIGRNVQLRITQNQESIKFIPDINQEVCAIDIDEITNSEVKGRVGEKHVRIRYKGKVIVPNSKRRFEIQY